MEHWHQLSIYCHAILYLLDDGIYFQLNICYNKVLLAVIVGIFTYYKYQPQFHIVHANKHKKHTKESM